MHHRQGVRYVMCAWLSAWPATASERRKTAHSTHQHDSRCPSCLNKLIDDNIRSFTSYAIHTTCQSVACAWQPHCSGTRPLGANHPTWHACAQAPTRTVHKKVLARAAMAQHGVRRNARPPALIAMLRTNRPG